MVDEVSSHGFSEQFVDGIVRNCCRIFSTADVLFYSPVFSVVHALLILEVVQELFLDIPNFHEVMILLKQANLSTAEDHYSLRDLLMNMELTDEALSTLTDASDLDDPDYLC